MFVQKEQPHIVHDANREPVAQLVECRFVMREVVSSTPAGPTLRVLKKLRRARSLPVLWSGLHGTAVIAHAVATSLPENVPKLNE